MLRRHCGDEVPMTDEVVALKLLNIPQSNGTVSTRVKIQICLLSMNYQCLLSKLSKKEAIDQSDRCLRQLNPSAGNPASSSPPFSGSCTCSGRAFYDASDWRSW